jgi:hypothetical protein
MGEEREEMTNTDPEMCRRFAQGMTCSTGYCHCIAKDQRIAELEAEIGEIRRGELSAAESCCGEWKAFQARQIAALEKQLAQIKAPEKISAKAIYQRLVGKLLGHWAELYPMVEWVDPEQSAAIMAREITELRADKARLDWLTEQPECLQKVYLEEVGWIYLTRQAIDVARIAR